MVNDTGTDDRRFAELVGAYGANPARWPASERAAAESLLNSSTAAQALATDAWLLDQILTSTGLVTVPSSLQAKLLADFEQFARRPPVQKVLRAAAEFIWPGAPAWQPAIALGLALAVGIGIAVLAPLDGTLVDDPPNGVFALDGAPNLDAGQGI